MVWGEGPIRIASAYGYVPLATGRDRRTATNPAKPTQLNEPSNRYGARLKLQQAAQPTAVISVVIPQGSDRLFAARVSLFQLKAVDGVGYWISQISSLMAYSTGRFDKTCEVAVALWSCGG
jgi:hypothetical protein